AGEREQTTLRARHVPDVELTDLKDDPVGTQRGNLEQHLALLDRRADQLTEIARYDKAVDRRRNPGAGQLVGCQRQLRLGLTKLRRRNQTAGAVVLGKRVTSALNVLLPLALPLHHV